MFLYLLAFFIITFINIFYKHLNIYKKITLIVLTIMISLNNLTGTDLICQGTVEIGHFFLFVYY